MPMQRVGGIIYLQVGGEIVQAKGAFTYGLGVPVRTTVVGADGLHGYTESPKVPFIAGEITDRGDLDHKELAMTKNKTITLKLGNGKVISLEEGFAAGDGWEGNTEEGAINVRWEGASAEEISA